MIDEGARRFGRLDILYNNAGVLWKDRDRSVLETDEPSWDRVMAINLKSVFWVTKHGIPELRKAGGGSIILMGSVSALAGFTRAQDAYTAAKGALVSLTKSLAIQFAKDRIRCNVIHPGIVDTPLQAPYLTPVLRVLGASVAGPAGPTLAHYAEFFGSWRLLRILVNSLEVSVVSTVITVAVALVLAYAVTRTDIPGKRFVSLMSLVPLISPPFLVSLAFILLLGRNGVVTRGLGLDWSIYGFTGIVASQVFTFLPQAYILLANVLGNIDASLEEAAENLGAGPLTTLRRVTLALARPGLASAALIVFILCMTDFGNPILIGGRYNVLATEIYAQVIGMNDFPAAAVMSVVLLVPCLAAYVANTKVVGRRSYVTLSAGARTTLRPTPPAVRWSLFAVSLAIALAIAGIYALIPIGSLVRLW